MIGLFWNCRGTGSKALPGLIKEIKKRYRVDFLALFETKCGGPKATRRCQKLGFDKFDTVDAIGYRGGLWFAWNEGKFSATIIKKADQYIHVLAKNGDEKIYITYVYASPNINIRRQLWTELAELRMNDDLPWILGGDFNVTLFYHEPRSNAVHTSPPDKDFISWFEELELNDLGCNGPFYTWKSHNCESRIDRCVTNDRFKEAYRDASVRHLPWFHSDHRPILLSTSFAQPESKISRPFRIMASWVLHEDFSRLVGDSWTPEA
ncbi:uncharacterized protein LOC114730965 [Neltuma alba]|uniref:uncharacterized protein LOC114730965 n=1 Tax=Neltuma alba TaxID=207710 RepID=UPI0010A39375|nr:uncharacterized protein LOC114730965 [Prosopis alba]